MVQKETIYSAVLAPNKLFLASGDKIGNVKIWNLRTKKVIANIKLDTEEEGKSENYIWI